MPGVYVAQCGLLREHGENKSGRDYLNSHAGPGCRPQRSLPAVTGGDAPSGCSAEGLPKRALLCSAVKRG